MATTSLTLVPTTFRLFVSVEKQATETLVLLGEARLQGGESVSLATEENFNEMIGCLRLVEQEGEEPENDKPIGLMSYVEEFHDDLGYQKKASYQLDVKIPKRRFEALMVAVNMGKLPSQISIETEGMSQDWQPDGSGKVWDNKTSPQIPIVSIWFITPLIGGDPRDVLDDRSPEDGMPPSRAQLNQVTTVLNELKNKFDFLDDAEDGMPPSRAQLNEVTTVLNEVTTALKELGNKLDSMHTKVFWLVILLVAMLAVLLWRLVR